MTTPVPGWYADPAGGTDERWWDGSRWTGNVRPPAASDPQPAQATPQPVYGQQPPAYGGQLPEFGQQPPAYGQQPPAYGQQPPAYQQGGGTPGYQQGGGYGGYGEPQPAPTRTVLQRNGFTVATVAVVVVYLLIAYFSHLVILGILPALLGFRAVSRKEPLGAVALVLGIGALVFAIYGMTHGF